MHHRIRYIVVSALAVFCLSRAGHGLEIAVSSDLELAVGDRAEIRSLKIAGREVGAASSESSGFFVRDYPSREISRIDLPISPIKRGFLQKGRVGGTGLGFEVKVEAKRDRIVFQGRVSNQRTGGDRAIDLIFRAPFAPPSGARWWPDITGPISADVERTTTRHSGAPVSVLTFSPFKTRKFRIYQPPEGGCREKRNTLWIAEVEAYGPDRNENLLRGRMLARVNCDSSAKGYSVARLTDGERNDRWLADWLKRGWASANKRSPHWVEFDFAEQAELARVEIYWSRERFGFAASREFWLETWDGKEWMRLSASRQDKPMPPGDAEKSELTTGDPTFATEIYPFAAVTDAKGQCGLAIAIPPDFPCVFRYEWMPRRKCLELTLKFGVSHRPRNPDLRGQTPFRFALYRIDGQWGFRDAARQYYAMWPDAFRRIAPLDGLWLLGDPTAIPNPHHYAYREGGDREWELGRFLGIHTFPYILVGQREFPSSSNTYEEAIAELNGLDPTTREYYGPGLKEIIQNCSLHAPGGRCVMLRRRRGGSVIGPSVATFPMNPDPSLFEGTKRRTVARNTLAHVSDLFESYPGIAGIYVDSLASWGAYKNARPEHFEFADLPLTHDDRGNVIMDNSIAHIEFLRALRKKLPASDKMIFGNGIRKGRAWAAFCCDVLGVEASPSVYREASQYAFFRTVAYRKPFLLLYHYNYPSLELPRPAAEEYIQSAVAYGIAPEERPFGKFNERDLDLYNKFIPILRKLGNAGWAPVTLAKASCARGSDGDGPANGVWLERFGDGDRGMLFTVYNPSHKLKRVTISFDFDRLGYGRGLPITELVTQRLFDASARLEIEVPGKSLRVLQIGPAPAPPSPPVRSKEEIRRKFVEMLETKWRAAGNILLNGGFEEITPSGKPSGWRFATEGTAEARLDESTSRTGKRSVYLRDDDSESYADAAQTFSYVRETAVYLVSLWVKQTARARHTGRLYFQWRGDSGRLEQGRFDFPRSKEWKRCEFRLRPPPGARSLSIVLGCSRRESTELYLDDVVLWWKDKQ